MKVSLTVFTTIPDLGNAQIALFVIKTGASYDPSISGPIVSINYSEDSILLDRINTVTGRQAAAPALRQDGILYTLTLSTGIFETPDTDWTSHELRGLTAADFFAPGGLHPDFSASGTKIEFGFWRAISHPTDNVEQGVIGGIDNWMINVNPAADLENLVTRFYTDVLDRDPEPAGAAAWLAFLQANCNPAGFDTLARNFFGSEEFVKTKRLTLGLLVSKFYLALLDRSPEPGGLAAWINVLRQARLAIALAGFIPSPEFRSLLPNRADPGAVAAVVERLYTQILGRASEPAGKAAWVDYIVATGDLEGAAQGFLASAEFEAKALTFPEFVTILYLTFLDRQPDQTGLDGWVGVMTHAMLLVINTGFIPSPEFQGLSAGLCS